MLSSPQQRVYPDFDSIERRYNIILADPPFSFRVHQFDNGTVRNAANHYKTMTDQDIIKLPVSKLAADNCALFLWVPNPDLNLLNSILQSWQFEFKTMGFVWVKTTKTGKSFMGMGHYTRAGCESCLLAMKGRVPVIDHSVKQVVVAPIGRHSEKPVEIHHRIVKLFGDLPRIELFSRRRVDGWDHHGWEIS